LSGWVGSVMATCRSAGACSFFRWVITSRGRTSEEKIDEPARNCVTPPPVGWPGFPHVADDRAVPYAPGLL
jgi:hypothetical protein